MMCFILLYLTAVIDMGAPFAVFRGGRVSLFKYLAVMSHTITTSDRSILHRPLENYSDDEDDDYNPSFASRHNRSFASDF